MIDLPAKFAVENKKAHSKPAMLLKLGDSILENVQTSQSDWENNSAESAVDYATQPGAVILEADAVPQEANTTENSDLNLLYIDGSYNFYYQYGIQSFQQSTLASKNLGVVAFSVETYVFRYYVKVSCFIREGSKTGPIVTPTKTNTISSTTTAYTIFDFTANNVEIKAGVTYYAFIWVSDYGYWVNSVKLQYDNTGGYANGQLDSLDIQSQPAIPPGINLGDAKFYMTFYGDYYQTIGYITTQIIDLGEVPTVNGEWIFNELEPTAAGFATVQYTCYGSTDGFDTSDVTIGVKEDGDPIESGDWYKYYKIKAFLITTDASITPIVNDVGLSFVTYLKLENRKHLGYEPSIKKVSSLATQIDDFDLTTVGQITVTLALTQQVSNYLYSNYPKNKPAKLYLGYEADGFGENDYLIFYTGIIYSWGIQEGDVSLVLQDISSDWDIQIPREESTSGGKAASGTYTDLVASADHHIEVMLEVLQNRIGLRDSFIDLISFDEAMATLSGWEVTETIGEDEQQSAADILNELRVLMGAYFIPQPTGKIKIKLYDPDEAAVGHFSDMIATTAPRWNRNIEAMINKTTVFFDHEPPGIFNHVYIGIDSASQANNNAVYDWELWDIWTTDDVGGQGESQIDALTDRILARYADPPSIIEWDLDRKQIAYEVGDMVTCSTKYAPSAGLSGIANVKYQIVKKNLDPNTHRISFTVLEV